MSNHKIQVKSGPEYFGETYIYCNPCHQEGTHIQFLGDSLEELLDFLMDHGVRFGQCCLEDDEDDRSHSV